MNIWQVTVLRSILQKECWEAFRDIITPDVFTHTLTKQLFGHIVKLHASLNRDVELQDLHLSIQATHPREDGVREELEQLIETIKDVNPLPAKELRQYVQEFVGRELAIKAAQYVASHYDSDTLDLDQAAALMARATELRHVVDADVLSLDAAPLPGEIELRPILTSLGLSYHLDSILCGGVGAGELLLYLGAPGRGKTSILWATATAAALQGRNVLGITLEISAHKCVRRIDQCLTKFTQDEWLANPNTVKNARSRISNAGQLWVKDWSYSSITVDDIRALITRMRQRGENVDYLMVDYLELISPLNRSRYAERHNWSATCKSLRALAVELQLPIISAWQVNRNGSSNNSVSEQDVSECWDVVKHADIILGLNQNPIEATENKLRIGVIKQRESTARPEALLHCNLDRMILRDDDEDYYADGEPELVDLRDRSGVYGIGTCDPASIQTGF